MPYKPGYKTTEFLVTVLVIGGQLIAALADQLRPEWAAFGTAATALGYSLSRGQAKRPPSAVVPLGTTAIPAPPAA